jgi:prevent-host-death family protein
MYVTSTDLKTNLGKYLDLIQTEDIIITRNGRRIAKLVKEEDDKLAELSSLFGILANSEFSTMSDDEIRDTVRGERLAN